MTPIQTIYTRLLDLYCIASNNDNHHDPAGGGETRKQIVKAVRKIINKYDTNAEEAEKRILGESMKQIVKQSQKRKTK